MGKAESSLALFLARPEPYAVELVERDLPALAAGEALIRMRTAGICGTDLHILRWNAWAASAYRPPFPLGHEFCGEIIAIAGDGGTLAVGNRVTAETHLPCGHCRQCRNGRGHTCENLTVFSRLGRGCFAEYTTVPLALLRKVPVGIPDRIACLMEPFGIALRAVSEVGVSGQSLLVSGCGPIGLMMIIAARALGAARVIAVDISDDRCAQARKLGADLAINPRQSDLVQAVRAATDGAGVDAAIDASGSPAAITGALGAIATGGTLMLTGLPEEPVPLDLTRHVVLREIAVKGVYGRRIDETWLQMERLLSAGRIDLGPVVTHAFPLRAYRDAIDAAVSGSAGKVIFEFT